jgi:drug resistance transporter, bcr/cflA subfamily
MPAMVKDLATESATVQLTLTTFLIGSGLGQVFFGPLSDRIGRRKPLLAGLTLYVAACLIAAFSPNIELLIGARLLMGLAGSAGMVLGRAIVLDGAQSKQAASALNVMMTITGLAPVVAPLLGGVLADPIGWRGIMGVMAAIGTLTIIMTVLFVSESLPRQVRESRQAAGDRGGFKALVNLRYIGFGATMVCAAGVLFAYIAASPFVYQNMMGMSATGYAIAFAINAIGMVSCTAFSGKLAKRYSLEKLIALGLAINVSAVAGIGLVTVSGADIRLMALCFFFAVASLGFIFGNSTAVALSAVDRAAVGTASAMIGMSQFALGGIATATAGLSGENSTVALAIVSAVSALCALSAFLVARKAPVKVHRIG